MHFKIYINGRMDFSPDRCNDLPIGNFWLQVHSTTYTHTNIFRGNICRQFSIYSTKVQYYVRKCVQTSSSKTMRYSAASRATKYSVPTWGYSPHNGSDMDSVSVNALVVGFFRVAGVATGSTPEIIRRMNTTHAAELDELRRQRWRCENNDQTRLLYIYVWCTALHNTHYVAHHRDATRHDDDARVWVNR